MSDILNNSDHDLLIRVAANLVRATSDVRELHAIVNTNINSLRTDVQSGIAAMERKIETSTALKVDTSTFVERNQRFDEIHRDLETRARKTERIIYYAVGGLAVLQTLLGYFL